jgi:hypothetical protein
VAASPEVSSLRCCEVATIKSKYEDHLQRRRNYAPSTKEGYKPQRKNPGTIDDKPGNYRRALGTIDDGKKTHKTQEKKPPK